MREIGTSDAYSQRVTANVNSDPISGQRESPATQLPLCDVIPPVLG